MKDLKRYDPKLDVIFNREYEVFIIVRKAAYGPPHQILPVEAEDGTFRQPDNRDLFTLAVADLWRSGQEAGDRVRKGEEHMLDAMEKEDNKITEEFREYTRDDKLQWKNTWRKALNQGSKQPEFRRIEQRGPGLTLGEIKKARAAGQDPWAGHSKVS